MKILISLSLTIGLLAAALAADNPEWAYPAALQPAGKPDDTITKTVPGSSKQYTQAQIDDPFNPPDWFPDEHPPMPEIVAHGGTKPAGRACAQCHLTSGDGHPESAGLSGLPADYIFRQMTAFKSGDRNGPRAGIMIAMAKVDTPEEIRAAANYFAGLKQTFGYFTAVEADTVPKSYVGDGGMRYASPDGGTEPIGERIIVLPKDATGALTRDPHFGFTDYVPPGSIARGEALATTGGDGKTVACSLCHGPNLTGVGQVPPIIGRGATYIYRQLNDIQNGVRGGTSVGLMKPVVANLTSSDMIALAAYLETRKP